MDVGWMGENAAVSRRFHLTFPERLISEPVLFTMGKRFGVVPNIRRASVEEHAAWVILELEGEAEAVDEGIGWLRDQDVTVEEMDET